MEYSNGRLPADHFLEKLGVLYGEESTGIKKRLAPFISYPHKCMYDAKSLLAALRYIGFQPHEKAPFDSVIKDIQEIEQKGRTQKAVIVEALKV
jgi:hypothetical protein